MREAVRIDSGAVNSGVFDDAIVFAGLAFLVRGDLEIRAADVGVEMTRGEFDRRGLFKARVRRRLVVAERGVEGDWETC